LLTSLVRLAGELPVVKKNIKWPFQKHGGEQRKSPKKERRKNRNIFTKHTALGLLLN